MSLIHDDTSIRMSIPGSWTLRIQSVPPSGNVTKRMHWGQYAKLMQTWYYLIRGAEGFLDISRPTGKRWILIVRYGRGHLDRDNLYTSVKPVIDVLRPPREEDGIYKSGPKIGKPWHRSRIGHALILEDDEKHLELKVMNAPLPKGEKPFLSIRISDTPPLHGFMVE